MYFKFKNDGNGIMTHGYAIVDANFDDKWTESGGVYIYKIAKLVAPDGHQMIE